MSLPPSYTVTVEVLENMEDLNMRKVKMNLLNEYAKQKNKSGLSVIEYKRNLTPTLKPAIL